MRHAGRLTIAFLFGGALSGVSAQDVEMLGERYGTRPPQAYYDARARDPGAFQFTRGRSQDLRIQFEAAPGARSPAPAGPSLTLGPRTGTVEGTYRVPVVLGVYSNSDSTPPFTRDTVVTAYFGAQPGTITDYYDEVSGQRLELLGDVFDWKRISKTDTTITGGDSGLFYEAVGGGGAGNFVWEVLALQPDTIDWGVYDNDGPDGIPNSLDDDGFVDVVAVLQPTRGAECQGGGPFRIWSHRWSLSSAVGQVFSTPTPAAKGGMIRIDDYTIQPAMSCSGGELNEIGVFTHELGHAFGLPDLYDTDASNGRHAGAGIWDLMASGSWGCNDGSPSTPCHMGAWTKAQLGWVTVVTLAADTDHGVVTLPPVESSDTIFRVDANDGSGEYFLLENRQRVGYDQNLLSEGLLVWQIDPDWIAARWGLNTVNGDAHMGVWLRQADGLDRLGATSAPRGDGGDPFPGTVGNDAFHAATNPAARSYLGGPTGVTLVDIMPVGDDMELRLSTRRSTITVSATGASSPDGLFRVNGALVDPPATTFTSVPFVDHTLEAVAGEDVAAGERRPFVEWSDAPAEPRVRTVTTPLADTEYVAAYGGAEYLLDLTTTGGVSGIEPGTFQTVPMSADRWFGSGTEVSLEVLPLTGFRFVGWSGALSGQANPMNVTMSVPVVASADFELVYAVTAASVALTATEEQDLQLEATAGTAPYSWRLAAGTLPHGLAMSGTGRITGASTDVGTFAVTVEATDANGLPASAVVSLDVGVPQIPIGALASAFLLSGPQLTPVQLAFLDRQGNSMSGYDVGDFRAWVLANPTLPLSASLAGPAGPRTVVLPMRFQEPAGREERR
jgi:M6 family metalloprotease-like protein